MIIYRCEDPNCNAESKTNNLIDISVVIGEKASSISLCKESSEKLKQHIDDFFIVKPKDPNPPVK